MKLKKINLKKGNGHNHPDIKVGKTWYLARIGDSLFVGRFNRQWYGLNFETVYGCDVQFDKPGTNSSDWKELYRIIR